MGKEKGQRAILVALAYPEPNTSGKASPSKMEGVHLGRLSEARAIVKWCPEYVEEILAGASPDAHSRDTPVRRQRGAQKFFNDLDSDEKPARLVPGDNFAGAQVDCCLLRMTS
jgi:hypothetical protein